MLNKGPLFSFLWSFFFMMSVVPLFLFFLVSFIKGNLPGIVLALLFGAIIFEQGRQRQLFPLTKTIVLLNLTLWFLLGLFTLIETISSQLRGLFSYLLLTPYALISGFCIFYLFSHATDDQESVLKGAVSVSLMIAIISAINGAIVHALAFIKHHAFELSFPHSDLNLPSLKSIHLSFLLVFILFNFPFVKYYLSRGKRKALLLHYLFPLLTYTLLVILGNLFKQLLLRGLS